MTTIALILAVAALPACFAITAAYRAGHRGVIGFAIWSAEAISREAWVLAQALRRFSETREAARRQWKAEAAR